MTTHSPSLRYQQSLRQKPSKMLDYGKQECMNAINNNMPTVCVRRQAEAFGKWFNNLIDVDRNNLGLYIADDAVLQWFGRTVKTKKDITGFLKYDMNCTSHHFVSVTSCETIKFRGETGNLEKRDKILTSMEDLAVPISGVTPLKILKSIKQVSSKSPTGKRTRSLPSSPEVERSKRLKTSNDKTKIEFDKKESIKSEKSYVGNTHMKYELRSLYKKRNAFLNDDCIKSKTRSRDSVAASEKHSTSKIFNKNLDLSYLPRSYMEAKCILHFSKNRSRRGADLFKWERQCKLQVAFSENPVCKGEYIIWTILYTDENKCRRNLLADFEAVSNEFENKK